jgi:ring-1,2-phenylacetyl-CoA epoxidase subunit PaaA
MASSAPTLEHPFTGEVADAGEARALGPEYVLAAGKVIASHVLNELAGAAVFDEPAIALAPNPKDKWLACRIAMEEYGHHLRFARLAAEFAVLKAVVDLAEVVLMEELTTCTYLPLRNLATTLLPEERFHVSFGKRRSLELAADPAARPLVAEAVDRLVPFTLPFFGRSVSANNELFRRWGIKSRTNDDSRAAFVRRSRRFVEHELGLPFPEVDLHWGGGPA